MRTIKFKDLLNSIDGITKGPFGGDVKKSLFVPYSTGCYKVYEQGVVANNNYLHGDYYLPKEYVELKLKKFILEPGDILITGAGTLGLISIVPENIQKGIINQALIRIRLNEDIVDKMFFKYFFPYRLKKYACRLSSDSVIPNMPPINVLKEMPVELPELNVQKKIASILNKIDTQIERNNTMIQKLLTFNFSTYCISHKKGELQYAY